MSAPVVLRKATTSSLAVLLSSSNQTFLAAITVGSLNAALLSSASAATCVTSVTPTFVNVISGVTGTPGTSVVTGITPTMASAVNGVTTSAVPFLTSANLSPVFGNAVTSASLSPGTAATAVTGVTLNQATGTGNLLTGATTGTVTGITPGSSNPNLVTVAVDTSIPNNAPPAHFAFNSGTTTNNNGTVEFLNPNNPGQIGPLLTVPLLNGTTTNTTVVTGVTSTPANTFLTNGTTVTTTRARF